MKQETANKMVEGEKSVPRLTVVIMAWNEVASLAAVAHEIHEELLRLGVSFEILLIDDGSSDGSGPLADQLAVELSGLRVHHHDVNRGLGGVYRTAFAEARGELLTFFPADGQFPAELIARYLPAMTDADLVLGVLPQREDGLAKLLSMGERALLRLMFGAFPRFQGILMFRTELVRGAPLVSQGRGWIVLMEFILRQARAGARIKNVTITIRPRSSGTSKVNNLRSIVSNLKQLLSLRLSM